MAKRKVLDRKILKPAGLIEQMSQKVEQVKENSSIVEVFRHYGVNLKASGTQGEYIGLCCFHDDKNPSLSVNDEKKVFKCHGCGKSGNIFQLVQEKEGFDFGEALKWLEGFSSTNSVSQVKTITGEETTQEQSSQDTQQPQEQQNQQDNSTLAPTQPEQTREHNSTQQPVQTLNLNQITGYHHKRLYDNPAAIEYLKSRGLTNPALYEIFNLGFADGSIISKISNVQKEQLIDLGILRTNGTDSFYQCLTFPILDDNNNTLGIYGRSINPTAKIKHLYLKGKHKGIFNRKASKVYDTIILTESIIDSLSLIQLGLEYTQPCYGIKGFTDLHLQTLKEDLVKQIIIGFDNDQPGREAADKLKDQLVAEGFTVKIIFPREVKDWNEVLLKKIYIKEEIEKIIEEATVYAPEKPDFTVRQEGTTYIFTMGAVTYRVVGAKEIFVTNLKVNIKARFEEETHYDNLDLYSARSRVAYSSNLSNKLGVEVKLIEKHLIMILEHLEQQRDKALNRDRGKKEVELTEAERKQGMTFLKNPGMFKEIVEDLTTLGYVGEDLNKQLLYLCASSRKLDDPISVLLVSQSASGKSMLVDMVRKLIPSEEVVFINSLSDQALNYIEDLLHKFLVFGEAVHSEIIEHQIREMLSSKELSRLVTQKDEKTGKMISNNVKKKTIVASVMSTTNHKINPENASRYFMINADESKEQTQRIYQTQRQKYSLNRYYQKKSIIPEIITKHHAAQQLLNKLVIVNPFAGELDFPDNLMRLRRDHDRFIDLIAVVCFLRQYQKEIQTDGNTEYIECDYTDYEIARNIIVNGTLTSTLDELPKGVIRFYQEFREICRQEAEKKGLKILEVGLGQRDIRKVINWVGSESIKKYLRILVKYEYLQIQSGGMKGQRRVYSLVADEPIERIDLSMIPTVDKIKQKQG